METTRLKQFIWSLGKGAVLGTIVGAAVANDLEGAQIGAIVSASVKGLYDAVYYDFKKRNLLLENSIELFQDNGMDKKQIPLQIEKTMKQYEKLRKSECPFKRKHAEAFTLVDLYDEQKHDY